MNVTFRDVVRCLRRRESRGITKKEDLIPFTFPYLTVTGIEDKIRLPGTWLHDRKTSKPNTSIITWGQEVTA